LLILSLLIGAWSLREWNFVPLLLVMFFTHLSLYSVRNIPLAVLIMAPIIATYFPRVFYGLMESTAARAGLNKFIQHMGRLSRDLAGMEKTLIGHWLPIALALLAVFTALHGGKLFGKTLLDSEFAAYKYPIAVSSFLRSHRPPGR